MWQMVAHSDETTENYHITLPFASDLWNVSALLFWFSGSQLCCFGSHSLNSSALWTHSQQVRSKIFPSGVGGVHNRAKRRVNLGLPFIRCPETWLQVNENKYIHAGLMSHNNTTLLTLSQHTTHIGICWKILEKFAWFIRLATFDRWEISLSFWVSKISKMFKMAQKWISLHQITVKFSVYFHLRHTQ